MGKNSKKGGSKKPASKKTASKKPAKAEGEGKLPRPDGFRSDE